VKKRGPIDQAKFAIDKFLNMEKELNGDLIELAKCSSDINFLNETETDSRNGKAVPSNEIKVDPMVRYLIF
jgi:hypothetical protein